MWPSTWVATSHASPEPTAACAIEGATSPNDLTRSRMCSPSFVATLPTLADHYDISVTPSIKDETDR
ncbi:hypothetical protein GCM10012278_79400 [Nonomuraea glycinis]|uniref:Uncharacterized protein n=1 Tax=Nonomuraea glycinis TaxID=2047744 RepID=A0A918AGP6_9ACTN|nr:hypothetical protein GCM10012278_79400 [Nonomuraea glycinis]